MLFAYETSPTPPFPNSVILSKLKVFSAVAPPHFTQFYARRCRNPWHIPHTVSEIRYIVSSATSLSAVSHSSFNPTMQQQLNCVPYPAKHPTIAFWAVLVSPPVREVGQNLPLTHSHRRIITLRTICEPSPSSSKTKTWIQLEMCSFLICLHKCPSHCACIVLLPLDNCYLSFSRSCLILAAISWQL